MNRNKLCIVDDGWGWAMPRSEAALTPYGLSRYASQAKPSAAIAGPSPDFIRRSRNPDLPPPARFEPTPKQNGDVVI
jgi:hypothetical protein